MGKLTAEEIVELSKRYTLYDWQAQSKASPIAIDRAEGIYFWSVDGKRFIDFNSQLMGVNIGHGDRRVTDAMHRQAERLGYISPFWQSFRYRCVSCPPGPEDGRDPAGGHREVLLHARRCRGE